MTFRFWGGPLDGYVGGFVGGLDDGTDIISTDCGGYYLACPRYFPPRPLLMRWISEVAWPRHVSAAAK